ncbi:MAG: Rossmann-like domain-containing protein [Candidatus Aminicenantales bacterium]
MIIRETLQHLQDVHGDILASERIEKLVVGIYFTAVQLSGGDCGIAWTELAEELSCAAGHCRNLGEFAPGRLHGRPILDILQHEDERPLFESIKLATLNAVSARVIAQSNYTVVAGRDPLEWIDSSAGKVVTLVGAFPTFMDKLAERPCTLQVLELDAQAFPERHRRLYVPAARAAEILPRSDAVILTGSTLVNHTLDELLSLIPSRAFTALVGPSCGLLPDVLFHKGVDLIGTIRILDPDTMFTVVSEGGAGYHLYGVCAEKVCILRE